jgi:hypothetical protein
VSSGISATAHESGAPTMSCARLGRRFQIQYASLRFSIWCLVPGVRSALWCLVSSVKAGTPLVACSHSATVPNFTWSLFWTLCSFSGADRRCDVLVANRAVSASTVRLLNLVASGPAAEPGMRSVSAGFM